MYLQLLKSKTILFSVALAVLSVFQGYIAQLPLTPIEQMWVGMGVAAWCIDYTNRFDPHGDHVL